MAQTLDEKGNIIINGFSTNQTPSQYSNSNIPVSNIAPVTPLNLPTPQSNASLYSSVVPSVQSEIAGGLASAQRQADQAAAQAEQARSGGVSLANLLAGAEAGNVKDVAGVYGDTNLVPGGKSVNDLFNQVSDINARATGLNLERQGIPTAVTESNAQAGRVTTSGVAQGQTEQALRQNALKALALGQEYAIASGNYEKARNYADQLIDTKFAQETARINALKTQQAALDKYVLTPAEAKRLEAVKKATDLEQKQLEQKIADQKEVAKLIVEAATVAPADVLERARAIQNRGGSAIEVATALGVYGADYIARQKIRAEIKKIEAETAKTRAESVTPTYSGASLDAQSWLAQYNSGALSLEDIYTKIGSTKEALALKNEVSRLIAAQGGKRVYGLDDASIQAINAQIKNVDDLLTGGVGKIVGVVQGGAGVFPDRLNVGKQDVLAIAKNLVSNQTLQALADAKSKGITFGALSEGELGLVGDAASRIAAKLIKDKDGNITGFSGSEKQFKEDLQAVKTGLEKSIVTRTQVTSQEDSVADDILRANSSVRSQIGSAYNIFDK